MVKKDLKTENKQETEKTTPYNSTAPTAPMESFEKQSMHSIHPDAQNDKAADKVPPLATIDAETLLATPLKPMRYIIDGLLPQGIHLLAGNPKVGKSWLVLWMCSQISKGEAVWNYATHQGAVLYLCLEDSHQRVQQRLTQITDDGRENLHFATQSQGIENGLCIQIRKFIAEHPDTNLVVIDTLQKIRPIVSDGNMYASDYQDVSKLKCLADSHGIAILLVHHLRKKADDDPYRMVSGTNALTGAVDSSFVLQKNVQNSSEAILHAQGRDIEPRELRLRFENQKWLLLSGDEPEKPQINMALPPIIEQVCDFIHASGDWLGSSSELLQAMGLSIAANVFTKWMNQHREIMLQRGVEYRYQRSKEKRMIKLLLVGDGDDASTPPGEVTVTTVTK